MKLLGLARIGNEPELRYSSSSMAILQLSLAYNYSKERKANGYAPRYLVNVRNRLRHILQKDN